MLLTRYGVEGRWRRAGLLAAALALGAGCGSEDLEDSASPGRPGALFPLVGMPDGASGGQRAPRAGRLAGDVRLLEPQDVSPTADGGLLIADAGAHQVIRIAPSGRIAWVAGTGRAGFAGDGGAASAARLRRPSGVAEAPDGTVLIADSGNHRIRRVASDGQIETFAGSGRAGFSGDGGPPRSAQFRFPVALDTRPDGTVVIADAENRRVRVIAGGVVDTLADGFAAPESLAAASDGAVLVAELPVTEDSEPDLQRSGVVRVAPDGSKSRVRLNAGVFPSDVARGRTDDEWLVVDSEADQLLSLQRGAARRLAASGEQRKGRTEQFLASAASASADGGFLLATVGRECNCVLYGAPAKPSVLAIALERRPAEATLGKPVRLPITTTMPSRVTATVRDARGRLVATGQTITRSGAVSRVKLTPAPARPGRYALRLLAVRRDGRAAALRSALSVAPDESSPTGADDG